VNTPHEVHYRWWLKEHQFCIVLTAKSYEDENLVVHEVKRVEVATDIFGVPKDKFATVTYKCGGGIKTPLERLKNNLSVSCWDCLTE